MLLRQWSNLATLSGIIVIDPFNIKSHDSPDGHRISHGVKKRQDPNHHVIWT